MVGIYAVREMPGVNKAGAANVDAGARELYNAGIALSVNSESKRRNRCGEAEYQMIARAVSITPDDFLKGEMKACNEVLKW